MIHYNSSCPYCGNLKSIKVEHLGLQKVKCCNCNLIYIIEHALKSSEKVTQCLNGTDDYHYFYMLNDKEMICKWCETIKEVEYE